MRPLNDFCGFVWKYNSPYHLSDPFSSLTFSSPSKNMLDRKRFCNHALDAIKSSTPSRTASVMVWCFMSAHFFSLSYSSLLKRTDILFSLGFSDFGLPIFAKLMHLLSPEAILIGVGHNVKNMIHYSHISLPSIVCAALIPP